MADHRSDGTLFLFSFKMSSPQPATARKGSASLAQVQKRASLLKNLKPSPILHYKDASPANSSTSLSSAGSTAFSTDIKSSIDDRLAYKSQYSIYSTPRPKKTVHFKEEQDLEKVYDYKSWKKILKRYRRRKERAEELAREAAEEEDSEESDEEDVTQIPDDIGQEEIVKTKRTVIKVTRA